MTDISRKAAAKARVDPKVLKRTRQRRRRVLTFWRMCRYGINNFSRNTWLTIAATAVMAVTLLIIAITMAARQVLVDSVDTISRRADMSIFLKGSTEQKVIDELTSRLSKLHNVEKVTYISAEQARQEQIEKYKNDPATLEAIKESSNEMPASLRASLKDLNDQRALIEFTKHDELYKKHKDPTKEPSFIGDRRDAINAIGDWVRFASIAGSIATVVFVVISSLVVFNTIRMAIFNRKDEIQMMKLIGADRGFIRGPFIVEAVMYGFIAALVASGVGYLLLFSAHDKLAVRLPMDNLMNISTTYAGLVVLVMIMIGAVIGIISSLIATRKYLKL